MKKNIAVFLIILCLSMVLCGCDIINNLFIFDKTNELVADFPTGDTLEFLITKDSGYSIAINKNTRHYEVTNGDGEIVLDFIFRSEKDLKTYVNGNSRYLSVYESSSTNTIMYNICAHKEKNGEGYVVVGWCIGTNTGFVATTPSIDRDEIKQFINNWSFNIETTSQQNGGYYPNFVKFK